MHDTTFELLTQDEAARIARCTPRFLQLKRKAGVGPPTVVMLGARRVRYERTAFIAWLKSQSSHPPETERQP